MSRRSVASRKNRSSRKNRKSRANSKVGGAAAPLTPECQAQIARVATICQTESPADCEIAKKNQKLLCGF